MRRNLIVLLAALAVLGLGLILTVRSIPWLKVGPAAGFALSLAIFFGIQVPWSLWWLRTHERGPIETLWARLTYGARPQAARVARV